MARYPSSVEVGPEPLPTETRPRRYADTRGELQRAPEPDVLVIPDLLAKSVKLRGDQPAVGWRDVVKIHHEQKQITKTVAGKQVQESKNWQYFELSDYQYLTYRELADTVDHAANALHHLGLSRSTMFNIFAATSVHWQVIANACATRSITFATAYDSLGAEGLKHSINEPQVVGMFTNANLLSTVAQIVNETPSLKVLVYDGQDSDAKPGVIDEISAKGIRVVRWQELLELGKAHPAKEPADKPKPDDVATIMYTSGSSGAPKGCVITHENIVSCVAGVMTVLGQLITPDARFIAYLPLAHIFELTVEFTLLASRQFLYPLFRSPTDLTLLLIPMGFANVKTLTDTSCKNCVGDIRAFKPTIMTGVPAVWELIRKGIVSKVNQGGSLKSSIFYSALTAKSWTKRVPVLGSVVGFMTDKVVFDQVKAATGGNLTYAVNGGAPISESTQEFLSSVLTPNFIQGFGATETCALSCILPPSMAQPGKVGLPCPPVEIKLRDFQDAGYLAQGSPQQGEICIRGPAVCKGYYKRPDLTEEAFVDGWFLTGDIGRWNSDGTLSIIDRKKNLIKLAGGEYIATERLESVYKSSQLVANICVHADSNANKPMAIIVPNEQAVRKLCSDHSISSISDSTEWSQICQNDQVKKIVLEEMNQAGKKQGLKPLETLQCVILANEEWTPQNGFLTAAQKLQRKVILKEYQDEIKQVYP
ncbi:uncharacterized protein JCM15063_002939 [Sporobolomyces koalae]|uniref:uncharacterized protein n=1 Tax=Sporobolomyces koalae TaxID=500713 RepID=UPI0031767206